MKLAQSGKNKQITSNHQSMSQANKGANEINLPKLDRIIVKSNNYKLPVKLVQPDVYAPTRKPYNIDGKSLDNMLKIEGRSSQHANVRYDYEYELQKKNIDRDIKA